MAHVHHCVICKVPVASCDGDLESCGLDYDRDNEGNVIVDTATGKPLEHMYCSVHHPHPDHKVIDLPIAKSVVKVIKD